MTTLKQQIAAVRDALERPNLAKGVKHNDALKDAHATLLSIQLIGEQKILHLPELIKAAQD